VAKHVGDFFQIRTLLLLLLLLLHVDIINSFIYLPTDALVSCLKKQY
jgi:hypothetical protein